MFTSLFAYLQHISATYFASVYYLIYVDISVLAKNIHLQQFYGLWFVQELFRIPVLHRAELVSHYTAACV